MAKKKKRRRSTSQNAPAAAPATEEKRSPRAERKELARQEREALIRRARRQQLIRRVISWALVVAAIGGIVAFFLIRNAAKEEDLREAEQVAQAIGCSEVEENPDEGRGHTNPGDPAPTYTNVPATSGLHSPGTLPPDVSVYDDPPPEEQAVHNLEHGYVIMWYRADGDAALDEGIVDALTDLAEEEDEVILAPHPNLVDGESLAFAAWNNARHCEIPDDASADDVVTVARGFITEYRNGADAPEPAAV